MGIANRVLVGVALFASAAGATDSKVCAKCHANIYRAYEATPMSETSGVVDPATAPTSKRTQFTDSGTGTRFRVARRENATSIHFARGDAEGERQLDYFIGAGLLGRSYASVLDGFLLQSPISYYASTGDWDLSPGFEDSDRLTLTRPVEPACLNCHASGLRAIAGSVNGYANPAFSEAGVSCERCHGPGETHVAKMTAGDTRRGSGIVNPAKLNPAERDSVCEQCHLVGVIRVSRSGASKYEPGNRLFDSTSAFLWSTGAHDLTSNSHFEQLVRSACWKESDGKLWCGSCHAVHTVTAKSDRTAFFRRRCLTCHTVSARECSAPADQRRAAHDDCIACHMPSKPINTVAHSVQVDHTISRTHREPAPSPQTSATEDGTLVPFPGSSAGDRELGLAYASEALPKNNRALGIKAFQLLKKAADAHPEDSSLAVQLAQLYDRMGQEQQACDLFARAVKQGVSGTGALVNLGTCQAKNGDVEGAMKLWSQALQRNPALEAASLNLAIAQSQLGQTESARTTLQTALRYDPFSQRVRQLLQSLAAR